MKKSTKITVVSIVGAAVVIMASVFAYSIIASQPSPSSPFSYIPGNSSLVLYVNYNGTKAFLFHWDNESALLLSSANIKGSNITVPYGNHTFRINMTLYQVYKGYQIFSFNISGFIPEVGNYLRNFSYFNSSDRNLTVYSYIPYGSSLVFGSLSAVEGSINSYISGKVFSKGNLLNQENNISFYYSPQNSTSHISLAWGGVNETTAYAYIQFRNGTSLNLSYIEMLPWIKVKTISSNEIEISFPLSYISTFINEEKKIE
jgi:hypothetical protein